MLIGGDNGVRRDSQYRLEFCFGPFALLNGFAKIRSFPFKLRRSFLDPLLQRVVRGAQRSGGELSLGDVLDRPDCSTACPASFTTTSPISRT